MKKIIVKDFNLTYTGIYEVSWKDFRYKAYLDFQTLMIMLEIEGYKPKDVNLDFEDLHFSKVELVFYVEMEGDKITAIRTSDASDIYMENNLFLVDIEINNA